ncbi:inositol monophosphatase family protein [Paraburkholderia caribensis]|uniref:Inositol monophosphatase n=2 Tax=Paraburkholderia TaxID=1822464 RepID=B2JY60_PARP8|nr:MULTISPECIES: inositol monophosphatase family protein [Paraburkholderia]ACC76568.1 inositol monophosphatase [Paraburkholderia phymatum STM815]MCO4881978.1 inositol phosphatase [Paraburkholderia caribensis]PTB24594.1 inositol phosphatase [Paraburkholderia caribensis]
MVHDLSDAQTQLEREDSYFQTVEELCDIARQVFARHDFAIVGVSKKADRSPVTIVDQQVEIALREHLARKHPGDSIRGEEFGVDDETKAGTRARWILDPLDGTRAYATGSPMWGTLIGVLWDGEPWLGAIDLPAMNRRMIAGQVRAYCSYAEMKTSGCTAVDEARLCTTMPDKFTEAQRTSYRKLADAVSVYRYSGDCANYAGLVAGHCDLVVESGLSPHDYLPMVPLIERAGGIITDWDGRPLSESSAGHVLAGATPQLHALAKQILLGNSSC